MEKEEGIKNPLEVPELKYHEYQEIHNRGFKEGINVGFDKGYKEGYNKGHTEGYAMGYKAALENVIEAVERL